MTTSPKRVRFIGATDDQVAYGGHPDPRGLLVVGEYYDVEKWDVEAWVTRVSLRGLPGLQFNSVCFEEAK